MRLTELAKRRDRLVARSDYDRNRVAACGEGVLELFSRNTVSRVVRTASGPIASLLILRWVSHKLAGLRGPRLGGRLVRAAGSLWRRANHR